MGLWALIPIAVVLLWMLYAIRKQMGGRKATRRRDEYVIGAMQPLYDALEQGKVPEKNSVVLLARRVELRSMVYRLLQQHEHEGLFPQELITYEAAGESDLAFYLMHPTELDQPVEVTFESKVNIAIDGFGLTYYVHSFLHPTKGKVAGVSGPVVNDDPPYSPAFSTLTFYDVWEETTPQEQVDKVHDTTWPTLHKRLLDVRPD